MGDGLYSAEFDMMSCCLLAQISPCGTTNLMVLCSSRGKVFHVACKYLCLARKPKTTYCGHTDLIKNQWSCAITGYLSQRENIFSFLSKFFQKNQQKPHQTKSNAATRAKVVSHRHKQICLLSPSQEWCPRCLQFSTRYR